MKVITCIEGRSQLLFGNNLKSRNIYKVKQDLRVDNSRIVIGDRAETEERKVIKIVEAGSVLEEWMVSIIKLSG